MQRFLTPTYYTNTVDGRKRAAMIGVAVFILLIYLSCGSCSEGGKTTTQLDESKKQGHSSTTPNLSTEASIPKIGGEQQLQTHHHDEPITENAAPGEGTTISIRCPENMDAAGVISRGKAWDRYAAKCKNGKAMWGALLDEMYPVLREALQPWLKLGPHEVMVDVGSGCSNMMKAVLQGKAAKYIVGVEFHPGASRYGNQSLTEAGFVPEKQFLVCRGDARVLHTWIPPKTGTIAICLGVIVLIEKKELCAFVAHTLTRLKKGGRAIFSHMHCEYAALVLMCLDVMWRRGLLEANVMVVREDHWFNPIYNGKLWEMKKTYYQALSVIVHIVDHEGLFGMETKIGSPPDATSGEEPCMAAYPILKFAKKERRDVALQLKKKQSATISVADGGCCTPAVISEKSLKCPANGDTGLTLLAKLSSTKSIPPPNVFECNGRLFSPECLEKSKTVVKGCNPL
eukprot:PhF_6_TR44519/c0_g1_i1/m.68572